MENIPQRIAQVVEYDSASIIVTKVLRSELLIIKATTNSPRFATKLGLMGYETKGVLADLLKLRHILTQTHYSTV